MMTQHRSRSLCLCSVFLLNANIAFGQTSLQVPLQFDFLNPGARSLALGGAFAGLADDATAAFTNPAGLTLLLRTEVSAEGRYRQIATPFLERGRLAGRVTNRLDDVVAGPSYGETTQSSVSPSFLSFVYPRGRWALALYRHEVVKLRDEFSSRGVFRDVLLGDTTLQLRDLPLRAVRDVDLVNYGVAGAYSFGQRLSVGGGFTISRFALDSTFRRFDTTDSPDIFGAPDFSQEIFQNTQNGKDTRIAFTGGFQFLLHPKVRVGAVYRNGPDFDVLLQEPVSNTVLPGVFRVPNEFTAGLMVRPTTSLTVAFDYSFVQYSSLENNYIRVQTPVRPENFVIDDGHELHGGVEYVFASAPKVPAVRFGIWYDPDHAVRYEPTSANDGFDLRFSATLPGGEDVVHYTAGGGISLAPEFEINVAGDFTAKRRTVSTSVVYRF